MKIYNEQLIKKWEALELKAYLPTPNDVWTIGWGHTATAVPGMVITQSKAQQLFRQDVAWVERVVNTSVKVELTQEQFDAVCSLVFNIGGPNFRTSTLLRKLNAKNYEGAALEFHKWKYQKGKVLRGLVRRRAEEAEYFLNPSDVAVSSVSIDDPGALKPLSDSKEMIAGGIAALTGAGTFMGSLSPTAQENLSVALSVALIGFGAFFILNRVWARYKGDR